MSWNRVLETGKLFVLHGYQKQNTANTSKVVLKEQKRARRKKDVLSKHQEKWILRNKRLGKCLDRPGDKILHEEKLANIQRFRRARLQERREYAQRQAAKHGKVKRLTVEEYLSLKAQGK